MIKESIYRIIDKFKWRFFKRCYKLKLLFISFKQDWFKVFSLIYFLIALFIAFITIIKNTFVLVDMSNFFLTIWWMLWAIFALCVTIHFFYVQNFLNYSALIFVSDVSNSKKNYTIFWIIWVLTIFFFLLWGNYNIFINQCPDIFLLPLSIVLIAFALWLIIYYFHDIQKKLSPGGIIDETENYFIETLQSLEKYNNLEKSYSNKLKIDAIKQRIFNIWTHYNKIWWYKLDSMCDNYLKLIGLNENRLAKDYLLCIENCFINLMQSYKFINTSIELEYFTDKTEIDGEVLNFLWRIKSLICINIEKNDIEWMEKTFWLLCNIAIKTYYLNYSDLSGKINNNKVLFFNLLIHRQQFFWEIIKYNNEEALFQRKEWINKFITIMLNDNNLVYDTIFRIESLLQYLNYLNLRVIKQGKEDIFKLYNIYGLVYLWIINGKFNEKREIDIVDKTLFEFLWDSKKNVDNFIKCLRKSLSLDNGCLLSNTEKNTNYIKNILLFIDEIKDIVNYLSKKEWLNVWNRLWLLVQQLWLYFFRIIDLKQIDETIISEWLNEIINIINIVITNKWSFAENIMAEQNIYDQICRIWIYAKKVNDICLFEKCFDILQNRILHHKLDFYDLWEVKYFCYRLFIEDKKNYERYFSILYRFFELQLEKYGKKFEEYWKTEIVNFINKINWCYNIDRQFMDIQISEIMLKDEEWVKTENQEKISKLLLDYCKDILLLNKAKILKNKVVKNSKRLNKQK